MGGTYDPVRDPRGVVSVLDGVHRREFVKYNSKDGPFKRCGWKRRTGIGRIFKGRVPLTHTHTYTHACVYLNVISTVLSCLSGVSGERVKRDDG